MSWWKLFRRGTPPSGTGARMLNLRIEVPGWSMVDQSAQQTRWRDAEGDALSLTLVPGDLGLPQLSDEERLRQYARRAAENSRSGLVEALAVAGVHGPTLEFIYKRLEKPAFLFTGMLMIPLKTMWVWTIVARERGTTGVREAVVTDQLMNQGKLTLESYQASWAQDPYDAAYRGVDRSTLRYLSDDECYDQQFPQHPLSKVRRELRMVLSVKLDPSA